MGLRASLNILGAKKFISPAGMDNELLRMWKEAVLA